MDKTTARISIKNIFGDLVSLNPSSLINLFEIDIGEIAFDKGIISEISFGNESDRIFRFHNNVPDVNSNIIWQGKSFNALPIKAEGFELNGRGTLPVPRLLISSNEEGVPALSQLKVQIAKIGDLTGAKVTRIRTLYKYLDALNFVGSVNPDADPNAEFPRDVYFIDRKSSESKSSIEYELASALDIEGIKLPARIVLSNRCNWQYRGEGCLYESTRVTAIHGATSRLPTSSPPVATEDGDLISTLLPNATLSARGKWITNTTYFAGEYVYVEKDGLKYYFVAKTTVPQNLIPPNGNYWLADSCSKQVNNGCKYRWGLNSDGTPAPGRAAGNPHQGCLPFGGFPSCNKVR